MLMKKKRFQDGQANRDIVRDFKLTAIYWYKKYLKFVEVDNDTRDFERVLTPYEYIPIFFIL